MNSSADSLFSFFREEVVELGIGSDPSLLVGLQPCIFYYVNSSTISQGRIFFNFDKHDNIGLPQCISIKNSFTYIGLILITKVIFCIFGPLPP